MSAATPLGVGESSVALLCVNDPWGGGQRSQMYGVVVDTLRKPYLSRIGREYSVESLLMRVLP